jgi:hypothetical protein
MIFRKVKKSKRFFFEKKKQKTFVSLGLRRLGSAILALPWVYIRARLGFMRNNLPVGIGLALTLIASSGAAQVPAGFDPPDKTVTIPSSTQPPSGDAVTCVFYKDVMIRMPGTDTPAPGNAMILPPRATCGRNAPGHGLQLLSDSLILYGRKGPFLVFVFDDAVGAGYFTIFDVRTGHALFDDGVTSITSVKLTHGLLEMRYNRGVNASCSLFSDPDGCWSILNANGQIPRGVFTGPPPVAACAKTYGKISDSDDSVLSYDAVLTLDDLGLAKVVPVGPLQCNPQP